MKWPLKRKTGALCAMVVAVSCLVNSAVLTAYSAEPNPRDLWDAEAVSPVSVGMEEAESASIPCQGYIFPSRAAPPANALYKITYSAGGGSGGYEAAGLPAGAEHTVLSAAQAGITRAGYSFSVWNTAPDGTGASYAPGGKLIVSGDAVLYAMWSENGGAAPEPTPTPKPEATPEPGKTPEPGETPEPVETSESGQTAEPGGTTESGETTESASPGGSGGTTDASGAAETGESAYTGGAAKAESLPQPSRPGGMLVPGEDGTYIEYDEHGVPLGAWRLGDDGVWRFEEYPAAGALPKTGVEDTAPLWVFGLCASLMITALLIFMGRRRKKDEENR